MSDKEVAIEVIRRLPEGATLEEISQEIGVLAAIRRGEGASAEGRLMSHAEVKKRSVTWASK